MHGAIFKVFSLEKGWISFLDNLSTWIYMYGDYVNHKVYFILLILLYEKKIATLSTSIDFEKFSSHYDEA